jgi:hypothetical protein
MKYAYAYVLDTMADWELGFVIAELNSGQYFKNQGSRIPVKMVGASKRPITTKSGMTILPLVIHPVNIYERPIVYLCQNGWCLKFTYLLSYLQKK